MSFQLVEQLQQKVMPANQMCRVLGISRSGFYTARKRALIQPMVCEASIHLKAAAANGGAYGSRRCARLWHRVGSKSDSTACAGSWVDLACAPRQPVRQCCAPGTAKQAQIAQQHEPEGLLLGHAVMERFFLNLKMECVWLNDNANHAEAMNDIADYIVSLYNSQRLHSNLGNLPPNAFEQKSAIKQPIVMCEKT